MIAEAPTRKQAGELEMEIAKFMPDKTDWRKMLKEESRPETTLHALREQVIERLDRAYHSFLIEDEAQAYEFEYPRSPSFQVSLKSINLDKSPIFTGTLFGIKGQYLLFDTGVLNVKKYGGYEVVIDVS